MQKSYRFERLFLSELIFAILDIVHVYIGSIILKRTPFHEISRAHIFIWIHIAVNAFWKHIFVFVRTAYRSCVKDPDPYRYIDATEVSARRHYFLITRTVIGVVMIIYGAFTLGVLYDFLNDKSPIIIFLLTSFCYEVVKNIFHIVFFCIIDDYRCMYFYFHRR